MDNSALILEVQNVSKRFGGVQALNGVNMDVRYGEVHALVGENGAGKSTLMNVLGGIVVRDSGGVRFNGKEVNFQTPIESIEAGVALIHQELAMMPSLNVIENIFMGRMPSQFGRVKWKVAEERTNTLLERVGLQIDPYTLVSDLSISQRQLVEIAKALSVDASLLIMDEPNSSLADSETERLFNVINTLKEKNVAIIYVSHKIEEVLYIADRVTVFRDGGYVGTIDKADATAAKIIQMMVGREVRMEQVERAGKPGGILLDVRELSGPGFHNASFTVKKGEIVGMAGLVGAGRSEVARTIFGAYRKTGGQVLLEGKAVNFKSPSAAIAAGISMLQEDRKVLSLFMGLPILFNMSMAHLPRMTRMGVIDHNQTKQTALNFVNNLNIKLASLQNPVMSLSGGNQQKTILARWLATRPKLLILDEPTHGVDVGAKSEIYQLIRNLADDGISILLISSELPEIMAMSDRVVCMHEGRVTGILPRAQCTEDIIMAYATGMQDQVKEVSK
jgi:ABC-type sugar transport system ATPase subunit